MKTLIFTIAIILFTITVKAHPDGAKPYWYPSSFIYGYVTGCADQVEKNQVPFTQFMWPEQVRSVCSCVVDAFRHSVTYQEILDNSTNAEMIMIATATFPICVQQEMQGLNN